MSNGKYMFDQVLDRLVEAEKRAAEALALNRNGHHQVQVLQQDLNNARSDLTSAKMKLDAFEKGEDAFLGLYIAIDSTIEKLRIEGLTEIADALYDKTAAAKKFIDPIPF